MQIIRKLIHGKDRAPSRAGEIIETHQAFIRLEQKVADRYEQKTGRKLPTESPGFFLGDALTIVPPGPRRNGK